MSADKPIANSQNSDAAAPQDAEGAPFALAERAAKIGYWRYDLRTGQTTRSPGMMSILRLEPSDPEGENWLRNQMIREDNAAMTKNITEAVRTHAPFYYRTRITDPDGTNRVIETHGEVELGLDGQAANVVGVCQDVTERVAAESARRRAEEMYRVMAEQASDVIVLYDSSGQILYTSQALERVLKRLPSELIETKFLDLVHPEDRSEAVKLAVAPRPGETVTATCRLRHGDGHYVWIEATTRAIFDDCGAVQNIVCVLRDITTRKRHEFENAAALERAEAANLAKSTFLANMSHELRTPLNAIIGFADMMRQEMFGPLGAPRYTEYADLIHESGGLLLDLISDILDMAKIEAGKLQLHLEEVELKRLVQDCVRLLGERAGGAGVALETELPAGTLAVEADRRAMKQILLNLLSNAVKFTMPGGKVSVRVATDGAQLTLAVADDGIGIPAHALSRLGRPFEQVSSDPTISKGGTGLGLALVHALAAKHGGAVRIESEEGIGTTVTVEMPLTQDARAAA